MASRKTNLQSLRKRAGFKSAKAFAEHMGMSVDTYTSYEQGKVNIPLFKAWELADYFGCTLDELAGRDSYCEQLDDDESHMIDAYRSMDDGAQRRVMRTIDGELADLDASALKKEGAV